MKTKKFISLIITLIMVCSIITVLPINASAAYSAVQMNVSSEPCYANLSTADLPTYQVPSQGDTYYINLAGTTDFKLARAQFYIKTPGQNSFSCIYDYNPSGYFRWVNCSYKFSQSGTYTVRITVTTTNGAQASGDISFDVAENTTSTSNSNTYTYDDITFDVVPNFKSEYCYNQNDYPRFNNNAGKNRGCTATAMCTAYSIYHDNALSPNDVKWSWAGTSWEYCNRYSDSNKVYKGYTYTQSEALTAAYNCVNSGKPIIVGVNGSGSDHVVTIVGVKQYADKNNLFLSDFLIVDPLGGTVETLNTYTSIDCGWGLRIPME